MSFLLDPAILFFVLGLAAGFLRSNLAIPPDVSRFLSLYLMMALGLKGGFALAAVDLAPDVVISPGCAIALALVIPVASYFVLRRVVGAYDAVAIAATHGSVSAVTFITAVQYLEMHGVPYGGHMAAALALMESPAIVIAMVTANFLRMRASADGAAGRAAASAGFDKSNAPGLHIGRVLAESLTDGAPLLLLGSMLVGWLSGESGRVAMQPFSGDLFKGMLAFFLLDMGLLSARNVGQLRGRSPGLLAYAGVAPPLHGALALCVAYAVGMSVGNAALLTVLAASASYIAVPAMLCHALPEANAALYSGLSLGLTFPFNILVGIPLYVAPAKRFLA